MVSSIELRKGNGFDLAQIGASVERNEGRAAVSTRHNNEFVGLFALVKIAIQRQPRVIKRSLHLDRQARRVEVKCVLGELLVLHSVKEELVWVSRTLAPVEGCQVGGIAV